MSTVHETGSTERRIGFAITLNLLAFLCFATMDTGAKWLVTTTMTALQVTWLRYLFHFFWVFAWYFPSHGVGLIRSKKPIQQSFRGSLLLLGTLLNFAALYYLPLTVTIAIFFSVPLIVCLLSVPVLGEAVCRLGKRHLIRMFFCHCWQRYVSQVILLCHGALQVSTLTLLCSSIPPA